MNMQRKRLALSIGGLLLALGIEQPAFATSESKVWTYLGTFDSITGLPTNLISPLLNLNTGCKVPDGTMVKVLKLLPEGKALAASSPLFTEDNQANILLKKEAKIKVAFVGEGAGYTNALGFFTFDKTKLNSLNASAIAEKIMFPNFSKKNSGGYLTLGDTVDLGTFNAGTGIGFTLVSNGWNSNKVRSDRTDKQIFRTVKSMNLESSSQKLNYHTVLLSDPGSQVLVIGIEDLNRENTSNNDFDYKSDDDFNDAVLAICVDPFDAIEGIDSLINIDTGTAGTTTGTGGSTTGSGGTASSSGGTTSSSGGTTKVKGVDGRQSWSERTIPPSSTDQ